MGCWPPCCSPTAGRPTAVPLWVPALRRAVSGEGGAWWVVVLSRASDRHLPVAPQHCQTLGMMTRVWTSRTPRCCIRCNSSTVVCEHTSFCKCISPTHHAEQCVWKFWVTITFHQNKKKKVQSSLVITLWFTRGTCQLGRPSHQACTLHYSMIHRRG